MSLIITGIVDGPLTGGLPKAIELYVTADIADLSLYGLESANNGGGASGPEFTFPAASATAGQYIYIATEATGFNTFFGFDPDYTSGFASINGDDAILVYENGVAIDVFGDPDTDGTGQPWDYLDGWAFRNAGTTASTVFNAADWTFSGPNALDNESSNATAATPAPVGSFAAAPLSSDLFISEYIEGSSFNKAIEIFNGTGAAIDFDSGAVYTLELYSNGSPTPSQSVTLTGSIAAGDVFVLAHSSASAAILAETDQISGSVINFNGDDALVLRKDGAVIDSFGRVGEDPGSQWTGGGIGTQNQTLQRNAAVTDGDTVADDAFDPSAQWTALAQDDISGLGSHGSTPPPPPPPPAVVKIHDIQGAAGTANLSQIGTDDISPLAGQIVTIQAIVTADFQDGIFGSLGDLNGFYVQEEITDYDFNDLTSEGIFIFDGSAPAVDVQYGDLVQITGTVSEFFGETQISATSVTVLGNDPSLVPAAVDVTFPVASVAIDGTGGYVANLEAYEGMLVNIAQDMTITEMFNLDRFGQYNVSAGGQQFQFTQNNAPDQAGYDSHLQNVAASTIVLDDGLGIQNPAIISVIDGNDGVLASSDSFRMGDAIGNLTGVVNYSFDEFRIHSATGTYTQANPRPDQPSDVGGNFKVASLNVLNYFTTIDLPGVTTDIGADPRGADSQAEFDRQAAKIVEAIVAMDADILGLVEIENDFAGVVIPVADLVARVNAALGSDVYAWVDPGQEFVGTDAIANAIIYKHAEVQPLGSMAILTSHNGQNFLDPLGAGTDLNRAAIAQTFLDLDTDQTVTVSVNHLKSKGSLSGLPEDNDQLDGQGNNNATRTEAAKILADWLASDPTGQGSANTMILGDLNSYAMEDPVTALKALGYVDLAAATLGNTAYSYTFDGQIGTLDYILASGPITGHLTGLTEWHINADEADAFDYNLDFGRDPGLFDPTTAARNSDHDPVIAGFNLPINYNQIAGTDRWNWLTGTDGRDRIDAKGGNDYVDGKDGDDLIIAGGGRLDLLRGGAGADTFEFSLDIATDRSKDVAHLLDFDTSEDRIDLGGAQIDDFREHRFFVEIFLDGGRDKIVVYNTDDFDAIMFTDPLVMV